MDAAQAAVDAPREGSRPDFGEWDLGSEVHRRVVCLLDVADRFERDICLAWLRERATSAHGVTSLDLPRGSSRSSRRARRAFSALDAVLATDDDPLLVPLRVVWSVHSAAPAPSLLRLLLLGAPHEPGMLRKRWTRRFRPERLRVIVGEPAPLSDLRARWQQMGGADRAETGGLAEFVVRQAALALDRSERRLRGMRYKVPRFLAEEILERSAFRGRLNRLAWESGRDPAELSRQAARYLKEIAATHSPYVIDVTAHFARALYTRGYRDRLNYDRAALEHAYSLGQRSAIVFLPSHKSNLDHLVLRWALYENGHPPNHTAGGINMNFVPLGPLLRRSGVFFIRRTFKDNALYKVVLGQYIDYLVEKRFPLEWYIEGGRSRSGKLLPPRLGLLAYVVDAYLRGKSDDVWLIPVSIAYDQIQDVGSYVAEQTGGAKERESLGWLLRMIRMLNRRYGEAYLRFGAPVSLAETLGPPTGHETAGPDERSLAIQKLAFEVSVRINRVTPVTAISLVTLALLGAGDRALTLEETRTAVDGLLAYIRRRALPEIASPELKGNDGLARVLAALRENGIVSSFAGGPEIVYRVDTDQHLAAAYYRNTVIHFFVNAAIVELSLLGAIGGEENLEQRFWQEAYRLRDLLKFEFFFAERDEFRREIESEIALHDPAWAERLGAGREAARDLLLAVKPLTAFLVLRPFLEAYRVVADVLAACGSAEPPAAAEILKRCLGLGKQYHLQRRIRSGESVSSVFFANALGLAANRGLLAAGQEGSRAGFAMELGEVIRRIDAVEALAAGRRAGLLD